MISKIKRRIRRIINNPYKLYAKNVELKKIFSSYNEAVILGSSSSISKLDISKFSNDMVITVGNFFEHPNIEAIKPKIHVFAASHPPITKEVLTAWWERCHTVLTKGTPILIEKRDRLIAEAVFKGREIYYYSYGGQIPVDFTKPIMSPWSVTIVALQLAIYCEVSKVGILGVLLFSFGF